MDNELAVESKVNSLELLVRDLTVERDSLVILAEKYKQNIALLSRVYATANTQLATALRLSEDLTKQYRDISRDRAESITHLLHGSQTVVGNTLGASDGAPDNSPIVKLEAVIAKREKKLNAAVRNRSFTAARVLTCFLDGKFPEVQSRTGMNTNYEVRFEYLARLDRELERLMSSRAYLLRQRLANKSGKSQAGRRK